MRFFPFRVDFFYKGGKRNAIELPPLKVCSFLLNTLCTAVNDQSDAAFDK